MSEGPTTRPCDRCGEWGCEPSLHPEAGSELAMVATAGALLGATLLGLLALPAWLRRFERVDEPPGHPRHRLRQDRVMTAAISATAMAVFSLSALVVTGVMLWHEGPATAWSGPPASAHAGTELEEVLALIEDGSPADAALGMEQLAELAPELTAGQVLAVAEVHARIGPALGYETERSLALREALRRSERSTATAAAGLAEAYAHLEDPAERARTLVALGQCADPEALKRVIAVERERYRTPELAHHLNTGCVRHVAHELLALAEAHPPERASVYRALADACDFQPERLQAEAGAAIAERWLALSSRPPAEQASPAVHALAHALACADEALLDEALASIPPHADRWTRAEVAIAEFRRGRSELEALLARAAADEALRRHLDAHYEGSAPWQDAVRAARERDR